MIAKSRYTRVIWATHLLFWLLLAILLVLVFRELLDKKQQAYSAVAVNLCGFIILVYVHLLLLLPNYFAREKYLQYGIGLFLLLMITTMFRFFMGLGVVVGLGLEIESLFTPAYFGSLLLSGTFFLLISIPLWFIDTLFKKNDLEKELKTHQLEAELRFLKAQVNPHFLFNALNNIYSLSFTGSKKAPEMILKLSDMMSYMLYDCKSEQVKLASEISYLENYIALQQLKKSGELKVSFETKGDFSSVLITPMLFIPFFENAFKHGNLDDIENGWLISRMRLESNTLIFCIVNSLSSISKKNDKGGVGLKNIQERLRLLYPQQHELIIERNDKQFSIDLTLNLNSNEIQLPDRR